jgi:hypothetical protein
MFDQFSGKFYNREPKYTQPYKLVFVNIHLKIILESICLFWGKFFSKFVCQADFWLAC